MPLSAYGLYLVTVLIWGSTWLAIKFQLGAVDPLVSVIYRFGLASVLLFGWCLLARVRTRLTWQEHAGIAGRTVVYPDRAGECKRLLRDGRCPQEGGQHGQ